MPLGLLHNSKHRSLSDGYSARLRETSYGKAGIAEADFNPNHADSSIKALLRTCDTVIAPFHTGLPDYEGQVHRLMDTLASLPPESQPIIGFPSHELKRTQHALQAWFDKNEQNGQSPVPPEKLFIIDAERPLTTEMLQYALDQMAPSKQLASNPPHATPKTHVDVTHFTTRQPLTNVL